MEDQTIPYHSHEDHDITGSITVRGAAELSGTVDIEIHDAEAHPADMAAREAVRALRLIPWLKA